MGYLDDRVDQLQSGLDDLAAGDEIDKTNALLAIIASELTGDSVEGYYQDGFESLDPGETASSTGTAEYSSREGLIASTDQTAVSSWGFQADTIAVRDVEDDLQVAFKDPDGADDAWITVEPSDSPFVLSGVYGVKASKMWYRAADSAAGQHTFNIITVTEP